jgi:hypothetical protein
VVARLESLAYVTWDDARWRDRWCAPTLDARRGWTTQTSSGALFTDLAWSPAGDRIVARVRPRAKCRRPAARSSARVPRSSCGCRHGRRGDRIMPTGGMGNPHFTRGAIAFTRTARAMASQSFRWDGTDLKTHPQGDRADAAGAAGGR